MKRPARGGNAADLGIVICRATIDTPTDSTSPLNINQIVKRCRVLVPVAYLIAETIALEHDAMRLPVRAAFRDGLPLLDRADASRVLTLPSDPRGERLAP